MNRFSLSRLLMLGSAALLALWLFPALAVLVLVGTILLWTSITIGILHEYDLTTPLRSRWKRPMDILDQFTNKQALESLVTAAQKAELIDAPAIAAMVKEKVIGQDHVANEVATTIRRRLAMEHRDKPVGVFCFAGPPGVGKTELGKQLAGALNRGFLFFDMSTCNSREGAATLFGSPKGYMGSDSYGQLTSGLRDQPAALVLLDEFEKANVDVMRRFLTAWNDGFITEASDGRKIATHRAIFILTTNAASDRIGELSREITERDQLATASKNALREAGFPAEVLSRVDRVFSFQPLEGLDVARVAAVHIVALVRSYGLEIAPGGIDADLLFDAMQRSDQLQAAGGVREIIRALEHQTADGLIDAKTNGARNVRLDVSGVRNNSVVVKVEEVT